MKVTLRTKPLSNGSESIYLDIYEKGKRRYEYLHLYIVPEVDATTKRLNENARKKANEIKSQFVLGKHKPTEKNTLAITLMDWYDEYFRRMREEREVSKAVIDHLHLLRPILFGFLKKERKQHIKIDAFGRLELLGFLQHMKNWKAEKRKKLAQGTMVTYQQRLVAVFNAAIVEGYIKVNPFDNIEDKERIQKYVASKEGLTVEEVRKIAAVKPDKEEDVEVQRAFLFACFTGLRLGDVKDLRWSDIKDFTDHKAILREQIKTGILVNIPLCQTALEYMPTKREDDLVFHLPERTGMQLALKRIVEATDIEKHVTFHTSRHTFASLSYAAGTDLATVSRLLGHTSISTTEVYADVQMEAKVAAIANMKGLFD